MPGTASALIIRSIFRAVFGPGTDERFADGIARLENWLRWHTREYNREST